MTSKNKAAIAGGGIVVLLMLFAFGSKKASAAKPPRAHILPTDEGAHAVGTLVASARPGISWGGRIFPKASDWIAHVRAVYGETLRLFDRASNEQLAAVILDLLDQENETAAHLASLNRTHRAFTAPEALAIIGVAVGPATVRA